MAEQQEDPGFTVVDRRRRGEAAAEEPRRPAPPPRATPPPPPPPPGPALGERPQPDLAYLCFMLYSEALVHLGAPDPVTGQRQPDLEQARFTIDLLAMLKAKTEGNRTPEESAFLDEALSSLRLGFVRASGRR